MRSLEINEMLVKSSAAVLAKGARAWGKGGGGELIRPGRNVVMSEGFYSRDKIGRGRRSA